MTQEHILVQKEQMMAARTKQHLEGKHTGTRSKAKIKTIVFKASIVTKKLPVSATKPRRGRYHPICHILPAFMDSGM